jgi:RNA 3'-terminal phosphate cyclase
MKNISSAETYGDQLDSLDLLYTPKEIKGGITDSEAKVFTFC